MNLEDVLAEGIPTADAADFFIRVRGKDKLASLTPAELEAGLADVPAAERSALLKAAAPHLNAQPGTVKGAMAGETSGAPALPPTAKGQNMPAPTATALPGTALGQNPVKTATRHDDLQDEVGRQRGRAASSAHFERESHRQKEKNRELGGRLAGGAAGGAAAHFGGKKRPLTTLVGVALGSHLGGKAGKRSGQLADKKEWEKKHAEAFKEALDAVGMMPAQPGAVQEPQGIEPTLDPATQDYLASEAEAESAAEAAHAGFLRQKLQEAQAQLQEAQSTAAMSQEQQAAHESQIAQMQQAVADSTLKATQAQDQVLQHQQAAAAMRMAFQQLRGQVLQLAANDPPTLSPDAQALLAAGQPPAGAAPAPTAGAPAAPQGPAAQAPSPGGAPNAAPPEGEEAVNQNADGKKEEPTGEAKPASEKSNKENSSSGDSDKGDDKKISVKVGGASLRAFKEAAAELLPFVGRGKTAALADFMKNQGRKALAVLPHAAVGAGLGAALGAGEALTSNDPLRQKVQGLEAKGDRGLADTMDLAQSRARLTVGEFAEKHPAAMMGAGAVAGGLAGAFEGPGLVGSLRRSGEHIGNIGKHIKTITKGAA